MRYFSNDIIIFMVNKLKHYECNVPSPYDCTLYTNMYHETMVYLQSTIPSHTCCHTCADLHAEVIWVDHVSDLAQIVLCDLHFPLWTESFRLDVFTGSYNILHSPTSDPERKHQTITSELDLSFSSCLD